MVYYNKVSVSRPLRQTTYQLKRRSTPTVCPISCRSSSIPQSDLVNFATRQSRLRKAEEQILILISQNSPLGLSCTLRQGI